MADRGAGTRHRADHPICHAHCYENTNEDAYAQAGDANLHAHAYANTDSHTDTVKR